MLSFPSGITGSSLINVVTGCGSCHSPSVSSLVIVAIVGPSTYQYNYTAPATAGDILMQATAKGSGFNSLLSGVKLSFFC